MDTKLSAGDHTRLEARDDAPDGVAARSPLVAAMTGQPWPVPGVFLDRLRRFYRLCIATYEEPEGSHWGMIADHHRRDIHEALIGGDDATLARLLGDPAAHDLNFGMDPLAQRTVQLLAGSELHRQLFRDMICTGLQNLAELTGARRAWHTEVRGPRPELEDVEALLSDLDRTLGTVIRFPNPFPDEYGLHSARGIISHRAPFAIHQAWVVRNLCSLVHGNRVIEIGGGLGRTAFYARRLGLRRYTLIDIPLSLISQAVFLGATLGTEAISLYGEPHRKGTIRLAPPQWIGETEECFDVVLNVDSLTEMTAGQAAAYMKFASKQSRVMFSMNHEVNAFRALDASSAAGAGRRHLRHASSMRAGYLEEYFFFPARKKTRPPLWRRLISRCQRRLLGRKAA